ncbi:hypothetical protein N0V93_005744 [Gnomoniopsis smithogilvyi]|uniref:Uncharacterized protein n=1 Tax=Gnomoniopsis smithogilvyi TaxID=1191159 RepID=A0A9W8YTD8_9PEZI|nr:hypothetical protein N0V93_005744 [Gnomoniopsis smithogilvyi]
MAPIHVEPEISYSGAALVAIHILSIVFFIQKVVSSLLHSNHALPVSQDVKIRMAARRQLGWIFYGLALLSLGVAAYAGVAYASLSFESWADERGVGSPPSAFQGMPTNASTNQTHATNQTYDFVFDRIRWLEDTPIYQDAFEIVAEKARRFWWGQQIDLAMLPWAVFMTVEGHRRGISNLFSFLALAHLVNLSFAQNAFYMALILTPVPLPEELLPSTRWNRTRNYISPPKPRNWCLKPGFFLLPLMASYVSIFTLPYAAGTPWFNRVLFISRGLSFIPLLLQNTAPPSMGIALPQKRRADPAYTDLFRFMGLVTVVLHGRATFNGLTYNLPHAHYHRHSKILPWDIEERSRWERTTTAIGKILGATRDHPVVAGIGYDVLISALSVGLWAALRPLGAGDILSSVVPLFKGDGNGADTTDHVSDDHETKDIDEPSTPAMRRSGRNRKAASEDHTDPSETPAPRRRGRPRKSKRDPIEEPGDLTYEPTPEEKISASVGDPLPMQGPVGEPAALAWGLTSIGGLALGSVGVFGGELLAQ